MIMGCDIFSVWCIRVFRYMNSKVASRGVFLYGSSCVTVM